MVDDSREIIPSRHNSTYVYIKSQSAACTDPAQVQAKYIEKAEETQFPTPRQKAFCKLYLLLKLKRKIAGGISLGLWTTLQDRFHPRVVEKHKLYSIAFLLLTFHLLSLWALFFSDFFLYILVYVLFVLCLYLCFFWYCCLVFVRNWVDGEVERV